MLATVAGEQVDRRVVLSDLTLHARNRRIWNGWMCRNMAEAERAALAEKIGLPPEELAPLTEAGARAAGGALRGGFPDVADPDRLPNPGALR